MVAQQIDYRGALNLYGGFWAQVVADLGYRGTSLRRVVGRASTLAWVLDDAIEHDALGRPLSFRAWCRFGGLNLDPAWWREVLLSGEAPAAFRYEDE